MDTIQRISCALTGLERTCHHTQPLDYSTGIEYAKEHALDKANIDIRLRHIYDVLTLPVDKDNEYSFLCFVVCVAVELEREDVVSKPHIELSEFALFQHENMGATGCCIKLDNQIHTVNLYTDCHVVGPLKIFNPDIFNSALGILRALIINGEISNPKNIETLTLILSILSDSSRIITGSAEDFFGRDLTFDELSFYGYVKSLDGSLQTPYFDIDALQSLVHSLLSLYRQVA
jgi:hypothetical protein